jgi:hypothetical protein
MMLAGKIHRPTNCKYINAFYDFIMSVYCNLRLIILLPVRVLSDDHFRN